MGKHIQAKKYPASISIQQSKWTVAIFNLYSSLIYLFLYHWCLLATYIQCSQAPAQLVQCIIWAQQFQQHLCRIRLNSIRLNYPCYSLPSTRASFKFLGTETFSVLAAPLTALPSFQTLKPLLMYRFWQVLCTLGISWMETFRSGGN